MNHTFYKLKFVIEVYIKFNSIEISNLVNYMTLSNISIRVRIS